MNKLAKKINWKVFLIWLFPTLFLIDDILGFNGYQFTIAGKSIRIILFCATTAVLFCYCLWVVCENKMSLFKRKSEKTFFFDYIKPLDYVVLAFIFLNFLWATVVPLIVRGELTFALKDFSTVLVLILYFPIVFLMRTGKLDYKKLEKAIYILLILLAVWHAVMYIGETISAGFYESYYDFIDTISFGTAVRTDVIIGFGITRIVQITSPMLLLGGCLSVKYVANGKYFNLIPLALFIFAICTTYTKSFWIGYVVGIMFYLLGVLFVRSVRKDKYRIAGIVGFMVLITVVFNYAVFDNTIFQRVMNSVSSSTSEAQLQEIQELYNKLNNLTNSDGLSGLDTENLSEEEIEKILSDIRAKENAVKDIEGTKLSSELRSQQTTALFNKWKQSKWLGFGYGAYAEDCIRNDTAPFMYESVLPAMIMKLGVIGLIPWMLLIIAAIIAGITRYWTNDKKSFLWWVGASLAFSIGVQTNPFLFTFSGFSMVLFILIFVNSNCTKKDGEKGDA